MSIGMTGAWPALVVDLGGTNLRLGLVDGPGAPPRAIVGRLCAEAGALEQGIADYLAQAGARVPTAALAIAGPVIGDEVVPSNLGWRISGAALKRAFGFARLVLINDFHAVALAATTLGPEDLATVGPDLADGAGPRLVIGPGTGLGMAGLIPAGGRWIAAASEGSQASFAPVDAREAAIAGILARHGRVTVERVISGPGLLAIDHALGELDGVPSPRIRPEEVTEAAQAGDARAAQALDVFFAALGSAVGDAALTFCATGGVILAGGILPRLLAPLRASRFRARFEDKAPLDGMMRAIPTRVIVRPHVGLIGAAAALGA